MSVEIAVKSDVPRSFRVSQVASIYDVEAAEKTRHTWKFDFPYDSKPWAIGLIVGPSGSGKTVIANEVFEGYVHDRFTWPSNKAIVDGFPKGAKTSDIVGMLTMVGFSSPPSWCKPYDVLSNGEKFRAEIARAILEYEGQKLFVIDEFTSVVDRTVAKVGSSAMAKTVRMRDAKMVAISCHYDILQWLQPDWVLDMKDLTFRRRRLRRPKIELEMASVERKTWAAFKKHHYLSSALNRCAKTYGCFWGDRMVAFAAILPSMGHKGFRRVHRIVTLPDFQGIGIGRAFLQMLGDYYRSLELKLTLTSSHPAMILGLKRDSNWKCTQFYKRGTREHTKSRNTPGLAGRSNVILATYAYRGQ